MRNNRKQRIKEPKWYVVMFVTAFVGGIVSIFVNHFDAIVVPLWALITLINWPNILLTGREALLDPFFKLSITAYINFLRIPFFNIISTILISIVLLGYLPILVRSSKLFLKSLNKKNEDEQVHQLSLWDEDIVKKDQGISKMVVRGAMRINQIHRK